MAATVDKVFDKGAAAKAGNLIEPPATGLRLRPDGLSNNNKKAAGTEVPAALIILYAV